MGYIPHSDNIGFVPHFVPKYGSAYEEFFRRLRQAREDAGFTQVQAAEALGKPQSFISKCESGERRLDILELKVFCNLYKKSITFFDIPIEGEDVS